MWVKFKFEVFYFWLLIGLDLSSGIFDLLIFCVEKCILGWKSIYVFCLVVDIC